MVEYSFLDRYGSEIQSIYSNIVFDAEDGSNWKNYVAITEIMVLASVTKVVVKVGKGRGDTGLYDGTEFMIYKLDFQD